jgi:signal transduction histidine kinase
LGGTLSLYVSGLLQAEDMFFAFLSWWMGDTLGVLLIAPLLLSVSDKSLKSVMQNKLEVILWILISIPASYFALNMFKFPIENIYNFEYLVLLMVVWAGLRFGIVGSSFSVLLFSIIASINTALGYGNFTISLNNKGLLSLWFFVLTNVVAGLIMSAIQAKQRQSEDEIKLKNEELNKINQEKDKFFSIVAHDLRSPLSTVNGFSELMIERISLKEYDHIVEYAHFIKQSSDRALNLLSNLMEWSVVQTGRITYTPELINIVDLLNEHILLLKETANIKSIDINTDYSNIVKVNVDKYMINTIVRNLISNAIKFTPKNGTITIKTFEIGKNLTISFSDTGVGMQDEQLNNLFKLNNSFSTVGTAGEKGTGLGLILCKEFIEKHKGKISVESTLGKGAIFNIIIPFC